MERLLNRNRIFVDRTQGVGLLSREEAINRSCSGPVARASGVTRDLRRTSPTWPMPISISRSAVPGGRLPGPLPVRMAEMWESIKIIQQALENLPAGAGNIGRTRGPRADGLPDRVILPPKGVVCRRIEGLISHFELVMSNRGFQAPCEEVYVATEAPNGELGFYIVGDGTQTAYRARCRPPSFIHFALFPT